MGLVTYMLAHVVTRHTQPLGTSFLAVWLILPGQAPDPRPVRRFHFRLRENLTSHRLKRNRQSQQNQKQTHPLPPRFSRKRKHTRQPDTQPDEDKNMVFQTQGIEPLDAVINVRLTSAEKAALKEDADLAGLSMSELVRRRYFGRPIIANADAIMLKELRRLGGLLKHIHNQSAGAYSQATASAIAELRVYIQKLSSKP